MQSIYGSAHLIEIFHLLDEIEEGHGDLNKLVGSSHRKLLVSRFVYRISRTETFVEKLKIDSERVIEIARAVKNEGKTEFIYFDHPPAIITITNLSRTQNVKQQAKTV